MNYGGRYFYDAFMSIPKEARKKTAASYIGLDCCNKLFDVEREAENMTSEWNIKGYVTGSHPKEEPACPPKKYYEADCAA